MKNRHIPYPQLVELTGRPMVGIIKKDLSRPAAYRLIAGLSSTHCFRGITLREYPTAEELWADPFFDRYFASHHQFKDKYYTGYLKNLTTKGLYKLSNTFSVAYCTISQKGACKIIKQAL